MPRLTIKINSRPVTVYQKNDVWRGGMVAFGRATRSPDDYGPRPSRKEVSGYHQSEYLLEEHTLIVTWDRLAPEAIAEIVGPEPSMAWGTGTITSTDGNKHQLEYKLSPHTKEQAEKVFRERVLDQTGKHLAGTAEVLSRLAAKPAVESAEKGEATAAQPAPSAAYVFRRMGDKGDFWQVVFDGRELAPVRHLSGMTYLQALLARPGHEFAALDLYEMESPPPPEAVAPSKSNALDAEDHARAGTGGGQAYVMDAKARAAVIARRAELEEELGDPDLDIEGKEDREGEIERLNKALAGACAPGATGGTKFESKEVKRLRQAIAKAIDKAVDVLAGQSGSLAKHLSSVRRGKTLAYSGGHIWET